MNMSGGGLVSPMPSMNCDELRASLAATAKIVCGIWDENKDLQGRFVNEIGELQRMQAAIQQMELEQRSGQLPQARQSMTEMQRRASHTYDQLMGKRSDLVAKLNDGVQYVALLQSQLIGERLSDWKNRQKLAQVGFLFEKRDMALDELQIEFEFLAETIWQLHTYSCWQLDLLRRGPQLNDNNAQSHNSSLSTVVDQLTKLLFVLISQSFVVSAQPEPVLKTQHKFVTETRLLIGDKLGIRQHLANTNVNVRIVAEEEARALSAGHMQEGDIKTVGSISNDFEKMTMDERGHMASKFNNSKLTRIAHRKPPPKSGDAARATQAQAAAAATDQKYALLFHITPFHIGNLGKIDVWTLSLPLMVTVHGSQDCDAQGAILWQRAFSPATRSLNAMDISAVSWQDLSQVLRNKFQLFTGARRLISDQELAYLADKLLAHGVENKPITFHKFAKHNLRDDVNFSFWEWLFSIMQLIKQKLLKFWDEGWVIGFISKGDASAHMMQNPQRSFLLRFSDTQTGAVSIGFVAEDEENRVPFHLAPFSIKDLDQLSLAQRIASCPQLKEIRYVYPNIEKEEMLRYFDSEERHRCDSPTGYIQSEIVMVAKTQGKLASTCSVQGGDSPSPMSNHGRLDWSPEVSNQNSNSMDIGDDLVNMLSASMLDGQNPSVEALLGPGFRPQLPNQPLQHVDLSFVDTYSAQAQPFFYN